MTTVLHLVSMSVISMKHLKSDPTVYAAKTSLWPLDRAVDKYAQIMADYYVILGLRIVDDKVKDQLLTRDIPLFRDG